MNKKYIKENIFIVTYGLILFFIIYLKKISLNRVKVSLICVFLFRSNNVTGSSEKIFNSSATEIMGLLI